LTEEPFMKKIMFVCLGNICRSPLAHAVFEDILEQSGSRDRYLADSSGTTAYHAGERADGRMRATAATHGIEISHRAQQLTPKHLRGFDLILCMDRENHRHALAMAEDESQRNKIRMLRDFDPNGPGDVPDPYYGGDKGFENVFDIVMRSAKALFEELEEVQK
jgi:protein-tyrosine phosphatase